MNQEERAVYQRAVQEALQEAKQGKYPWLFIDYVWEEGEEWLPRDERMAQMVEMVHKEASELGGQLETRINEFTPEQYNLALRAAPPAGHSPPIDTFPGLVISKAEVATVEKLMERAVERAGEGIAAWCYYRFVWDQEAPEPPPLQVNHIAMVARSAVKRKGGKLEMALRQTNKPRTFLIGFRAKLSPAGQVQEDLRRMRLSIASGAGECMFYRNRIGMVGLGILYLGVRAWANREGQ